MVRIVLVGRPSIVRELVEAAVEREPDLELVGEERDATGLEEVLARTGVQVVIAADDAVSEARALALVSSAPVRVATLMLPEIDVALVPRD